MILQNKTMFHFMSTYKRVPLPLICLMLVAGKIFAQTQQWTRQFGGPLSDGWSAVSTDSSGNIYAAGLTTLPLDLADPYSVQSDALVRKYDLAGNLLWERQFGTTNDEVADGITVDNLGNPIVAGHTAGSLIGPSKGAWDAYIRKYDASGAEIWTRQFGTAKNDEFVALSSDQLGSIYAAGLFGGDFFGIDPSLFVPAVCKIDDLGNLLWSQTFDPSSGAHLIDVSADGLGNLYVSGTTTGNLAAPNAGFTDGFVRKYDSAGQLIWTRQFGTSDYEGSTHASADALGNVFVSGSTFKSLAGPVVGLQDAYLLKFDSSGNLKWGRQFGTAHQTNAVDVIVDNRGGAFLVGSTDGDLEGTSFGAFDSYLRKYDSMGKVIWTQQLGSTKSDHAAGVATDGNGNVFLAGFTEGYWEVDNAGGVDAFLARYTDTTVPEPTSTAILCGAIGIVLAQPRRRINANPAL